MTWTNEDLELIAYDVQWISNGGIDPTLTTAPAISNVSPTPGSFVPRTQMILCDVTDADGVSSFRRIILVIELPNGTKEVVHDGTAFCAPYATSSARTSITNGYHYDIVRDSGWPSRFTLTPYAIDTTGNEAA